MTRTAFLEAVASGPAELEKLRSLGVDTPEALLAQIEAGRDAFNQFVGNKQATLIVKRLRALVGHDQPLSTPLPIGRLGVPLQPPPTPDTLWEDKEFLRTRDELFHKLQDLKASGAGPNRIRQAEMELDELLREKHRH